MSSKSVHRRQVTLRDYRFPGEVKSLVLTFLILVSLYALAIFFFLKNPKRLVETVLLTMLGIAAYVITVIVQQKSAFGTLVRVGLRQFPEIFEAGKLAANRLCATPAPIYVKRSSEQNIYTLGFFGQPLIVITSSMIDQMSQESLQFFIGRQIGHICAGHTGLRMLLRPFGTGIPVIGKLLDSVIFGHWMKCTEFTADRAGFLACDSLTVAVSTMLKFSVGVSLYEKLDIREFLEQINELHSVGGRVTEIMAEQPYLVKRIRLLTQFALSAEIDTLDTKDHQGTVILSHLPQAYLNAEDKEKKERPSIPPAALPDAKATILMPADQAAPIEQNSIGLCLKLVAVQGNAVYEIHKLRTRIGREIDNDIVLSQDERVSRYHAEIVRQGNNWLIVDCKSSNGVWVNQQKIQQDAILHPKDQLRLGQQEFLVSEFGVSSGTDHHK